MTLHNPIEPEERPPAPAARPAPAQDRVVSLRPRQTVKPVGRWYSRFVGVMKVILPLVAIGIIAGVVLWPTWQNRQTFDAELIATADGATTMLGPRLIGTDAQDRPYTVIAQSALQSAEASHIIDLVQPKAEIATDTGALVVLTAAQGRFDRDANRLWLQGDVRLSRDDGHSYVTQEAHIDLDTQSAWGDDPVAGHGPFGEIRSQGFRFDNRTGVLSLTGPSTMVMPPDGEEPAR